MKCNHCGMEIPDNSKFCIYCGAAPTAVSEPAEETVVCPACGREVAAGSRFCTACGHRMEAIPDPVPAPQPAPAPVPEEPEAPAFPETAPVEPVERTSPAGFVPAEEPVPADLPAEPAPADKPARGRGAITIVLAVLLVLALGFGVWMAILRSDDAETIARLRGDTADLRLRVETLEGENAGYADQVESANNRADDLQGQVDSLQQELDAAVGENSGAQEALQEKDARIAELEEQMTAAEPYLYRYEELLEALDTGYLGYAAEEFRVDQGVILLDDLDSTYSLTLTTAYAEGITVNMQTYGDSAMAEFTEDSWGSETEIRITPLQDGVTTLYFDNETNFDSFTVVIIVESGF